VRGLGDLADLDAENNPLTMPSSRAAVAVGAIP
jgi:hypothetical protein